MIGRFAIAAAILALLGAAAWWLFSSTDVEESPIVEPAASAPTPNAPTPTLPPPTPRERTVVPVEPTPEPTPSGERVPIEITVKVFDAQGKEQAGATGRLRLANVLAPGRSDSVLVDIRGGRGTANVAAGAALVAHEAVLDGRVAWFSRSPEAISTDGILALDARWLQALTLVVRDAASGEALSAIEVAAPGPSTSGALEHPGVADALVPIVRDGRSPVPLAVDVLPDDPRADAVFVRAPGRHWQRVEIDPRLEPQRDVSLAAGGDLDVTLVGPRAPGLMLRVRMEQRAADPYAELAISEEDAIALESLRPGRYVVVAEIGHAARDPKSWGRAQCEIVAGRRTAVTLTIAAPVAVEPVALAGSIFVPAAWKSKSLTLNGSAAADVARGHPPFTVQCAPSQPGAPEMSDSWRFDAGSVAPGRWELNVQPINFSAVVDVPAAGLRDARIEVPAPAAVAVRVIDGDGAELDANAATVAWSAESPRGWTSAPFPASATWNPATLRYDFVAPVGKLTIRADALGFRPAEQSLTAIGGNHEVTIKLDRASSFVLLLQVDGKTIDLPHQVALDFVPLEGQPHPGFFAPHFDGGLEIGVLEPGKYRLKIGEIMGYAKIADRDVNVEKGKKTETIVELVRR